MIDRDHFFDTIRESVFNGVLSQRQVNGMNYLLDTWENFYPDRDLRWLAYALATAFHETAGEMRPIEEYGLGAGKPYGEPAGEFNQCYYGRGFVQLTWLENYQKAEEILKNTYDLATPCVEYPHRLLEDEPSALVLYDGMMQGWFTGVGLPKYFNPDIEDPVNARKIVNGLDKADLIAGYYASFKEALGEHLERHADKWAPEPNTGCWIWTAGVNSGRTDSPKSRDQPRIYVGRRKMALVSRLVCEEMHGPPPTPKHHAAHSTPNGCVGSLCVNGGHLRWATAHDNHMDVSAEERSDRVSRGHARLSPEERSNRSIRSWITRRGG